MRYILLYMWINACNFLQAKTVVATPLPPPTTPKPKPHAPVYVPPSTLTPPPAVTPTTSPSVSPAPSALAVPPVKKAGRPPKQHVTANIATSLHDWIDMYSQLFYVMDTGDFSSELLLHSQILVFHDEISAHQKKILSSITGTDGKIYYCILCISNTKQLLCFILCPMLHYLLPLHGFLIVAITPTSSSLIVC